MLDGVYDPGMRWAVSIPQFVDHRAFDPVAFRDYLRRAEQLQFDSAWTQDGVFGSGSLASPIELMTYAAACTERLRLGCGVFVTPLRQPVHLAKSLSTLDQLSRGRVEIGVGTGGLGRPFSAFEVDPEAGIVTRFNEGLRLMKALWTEQTVSFDGRFWKLDGEALQPKPFQNPYPPIWFGGHAPAALRRAVSQGDGFLGGASSTAAAFAGHVSIVHRELDERGRDPGGFPIGKKVYLAIDDDVERARSTVLAGLVRTYGDSGRDLEPATIAGSPDACIEGLRVVADAGADMIVLNTFSSQVEQLERLATDVIPHVS